MAINFKGDFASMQKILGYRAYVTANSSTVIASSGLTSISSPATGQFYLNYAFTHPDNTAAVALLPNNNYHYQSWYDTNETGRVKVNFYDGSWRNPSRWSAMVVR